jgi:hypothetical protein
MTLMRRTESERDVSQREAIMLGCMYDMPNGGETANGQRPLYQLYQQ